MWTDPDIWHRDRVKITRLELFASKRNYFAAILVVKRSKHIHSITVRRVGGDRRREIGDERRSGMFKHGDKCRDPSDVITYGVHPHIAKLDRSLPTLSIFYKFYPFGPGGQPRAAGDYLIIPPPIRAADETEQADNDEILVTEHIRLR